MRNQRVQTLVETALSVALAAVLNFLAMRLPIHVAGGSISLTMLPIAILAIRRGALPGASAGALFGLIDLLVEPYILVPAQVALDYPLPYLLLGLGVGTFASLYRRFSTGDINGQPAVAGALAAASPEPAAPSGRLAAGSFTLAAAMLLGGTMRLASHVLSGVLFFAEYAGDQNVWVYSLVYNITYIGPSLIASLACAIVLMPILNRAVPAT